MNDFTFYFTLGIEHISGWSAFDHLLFLVALAAGYSVLQWRKVLLLVTAFTIGHALALGFSVLKIVEIPSYWVELLIAASIMVTALSGLLFSQKKKIFNKLSYSLSLLFGLVHGLGFATTIIYMLPADLSALWPICFFNLGLEVVQISAVLFILLLRYVLLKITALSEAQWVVTVEAMALAGGLWLFLFRL